MDKSGPTPVTPWTRFFYFTHICNSIAALAFVLNSYFIQEKEREVLGDFNLKITNTVAHIYYIAAGFLVLAAVIGFLAQKLAHKPTLWILYCMLMSVLSVVELALAVAVLGKIRGHNTEKMRLKNQMEDYYSDNSEGANKWDQLQIRNKCCGVESYMEWQDYPYGRTTLRTPKSCCLPPNNTDSYCSLNVLPSHDEANKFVYTRGCWKTVTAPLDFQFTIMGITGMVIFIVHFIWVSLSCLLVITKKV